MFGFEIPLLSSFLYLLGEEGGRSLDLAFGVKCFELLSTTWSEDSVRRGV